MAERDLDVIVFGATGVTGRQVARYLAGRAAESGLRWAAAARDPARLAEALEQVGAGGSESLEADLSSPPSISSLARRSRVVLDLVGPYTRYGRPVIDACVREGAHYVDLTGELPFVREMIGLYDQPARAAGVKVVQVCGFEALPADLLTALLARAATRRGDRLATVDLEVEVSPPPGIPRASEAISGGTFQSLVEVAGSESAGAITDPALLIADPVLAAEVRRTSPIPLAPRRGRDGGLIAPMAPAPFINPAVIHRSEELRAAAEERPPAPFAYREGIALTGGLLSLPLRVSAAAALSATQASLGLLARSRPAVRTRAAAAMRRFGPQSGFGPSGDRMEGWRWRMRAYACTREGGELVAHLEADGHPGYLATARLLGETGMLLAEPGATPESAGCLTPAAALGTECVPRFARAHLRFEGPV